MDVTVMLGLSKVLSDERRYIFGMLRLLPLPEVLVSLRQKTNPGIKMLIATRENDHFCNA